MQARKSIVTKALLLLPAAVLFHTLAAYARFGGGGGRHSGSGSHSYSSHGGGFGGGGYGGGLPLSPGMIVLIIIVLILYFIFKNKFASGSDGGDRQQFMPATPQNEFPEGLTPEKVRTAFMELQDAWQRQDLNKVRKWMSDGMYQRLTAQFDMMKKLSQRNMLSNIRIENIYLSEVKTDGAYEIADVAITFSMDDEFISEKYPSLNESFEGDGDTEYWTFIKRTDAQAPAGTDLYNTENCPNCGASLENKLGEVSRCSSCGTLTNNAAYDWILSEVSQADDYSGSNTLQHDGNLHDLTKNDPLFSIQRSEDIASNVFMQIMEVLTGDSNKKLDRFADKALAEKILQQKTAMGNFVFDRLYLNDVTLAGYNTDNNKLNLTFSLTATYQRVQAGTKLVPLDRDMTMHRFTMVLSKDIAALAKPQKEVAFSYECANCGAPYDDTTKDTCSYCDAPVVDTARNWVLTDFSGF
ncbi:TIM44-like domain-containing protein [Chitinophagaceae bacterium MMS25-I14]